MDRRHTLSRRALLAAAAALPALPALAANPAWTTEAVTSATDGARIVYHVAGKGPTLVVVHGGSTTSAAYRAFAAPLLDRFEVALVDRRNYTVSQATGSPHTFQQEVGDIAAVMRKLGGPSYLFGHSAGALVSMHVARSEGGLVKALALYEPPLSGGGPSIAAVRQRLDALAASGQTDAAIAYLYQTFVGLDPATAQTLVAARGPELRAVFEGSRLDIEALQSLDTDPKAWRGIAMPTLLLVGDQSVEHPLRDSIAQLAAVLPDSRTVTLKGQGHAAYSGAPQMLADAVGGFFAARSG